MKKIKPPGEKKRLISKGVNPIDGSTQAIERPQSYWTIWRGDLADSRKWDVPSKPFPPLPHEGLCDFCSENPASLMEELLFYGWAKDRIDQTRNRFARIETTATGMVVTSFETYEAACDAHRLFSQCCPKTESCSDSRFPERLAVVIDESGLGRPQFAAKVGVGTSCLAKWLSGKLQPKSMQLLAIAQASTKTMEWLLIGDTEYDGQRLERIRIERQLTWAELAEVLKLSESMAYQVRSGKRRLSKKALHRLESLEKQFQGGEA